MSTFSRKFLTVLREKRIELCPSTYLSLKIVKIFWGNWEQLNINVVWEDRKQ